MQFREQNRQAWDHLARSGSQFAHVATDEECGQPLLSLDTHGWLPGSVQGLDVLCLAGGGGWQSILYAAAGARVTVADLSPAMLALDEREAARRKLTVRVLEASMDDLSPLPDRSFDIVHQPVSTCYVPRLKPVYAEIARVLRPGGLYISQHKQPTSLQIVDRDGRDRYIVGVGYYHNDPLPAVIDESYREDGAVEYLHRWEELIGELCAAGFVIEALTEPRRGDPKAKPGHFKHRGLFVPPYVRLKARRSEAKSPVAGRSPIWTPE
ncbi:MAG: class I SAM-dependent methyltransferase [Planctomycetota bacterium]|nr:MAG: class I SAM-dependent methyltransferase [Planctomycetota bacterium]REJ87927.1 MAG: class I SAM-dependent methyltransferase [Planctomycetota bacterium]REK23241.1 MAG: class I SAM-dependent methyltransferase [Planctomycetota bacterium]REK30838.1 MAG: class I SAM-dependent methyltransferase [Planctomycetota bacterium]